jgi:hypothetical protein
MLKGSFYPALVLGTGPTGGRVVRRLERYLEALAPYLLGSLRLVEAWPPEGGATRLQEEVRQATLSEELHRLAERGLHVPRPVRLLLVMVGEAWPQEPWEALLQALGEAVLPATALVLMPLLEVGTHPLRRRAAACLARLEERLSRLPAPNLQGLCLPLADRTQSNTHLTVDDLAEMAEILLRLLVLPGPSPLREVALAAGSEAPRWALAGASALEIPLADLREALAEHLAARVLEQVGRQPGDPPASTALLQEVDEPRLLARLIEGLPLALARPGPRPAPPASNFPEMRPPGAPASVALEPGHLDCPLSGRPVEEWAGLLRDFEDAVGVLKLKPWRHLLRQRGQQHSRELQELLRQEIDGCLAAPGGLARARAHLARVRHALSPAMHPTRALASAGYPPTAEAHRNLAAQTLRLPYVEAALVRALVAGTAVFYAVWQGFLLARSYPGAWAFLPAVLAAGLAALPYEMGRRRLEKAAEQARRAVFRRFEAVLSEEVRATLDSLDAALERAVQSEEAALDRLEGLLEEASRTLRQASAAPRQTPSPVLAGVMPDQIEEVGRLQEVDLADLAAGLVGRPFWRDWRGLEATGLAREARELCLARLPCPPQGMSADRLARPDLLSEHLRRMDGLAPLACETGPLPRPAQDYLLVPQTARLQGVFEELAARYPYQRLNGPDPTALVLLRLAVGVRPSVMEEEP